MDPLIQVPNPQNCNKHNQPIILYDPDPNKRAYCVICMQQKTGMISAESYSQKLKTIIQQETEQYKNNIQLFQDWHNKILIYKNNLISSLDKILQVIVDQIKIIKINKENLQQLSQQSTDHQKTIQDVQQKSQNSQKENEQVKEYVKQLLLDFQQKYFNDELFNQLYQNSEIQIEVAQINERRFKYELIEKSYKQGYAFPFNKLSNILVVACVKEIIIYQFNKGVVLNEIQKLTDHTDNVLCLYFIKQSNQFVSGSKDNSIIIWDLDQDKNQWFAQTQLKDHNSNPYCLQMNKSENLLISGNANKTIKFWNKINSRWSIQQTVKVNETVYDISLNEKENKLISCICYKVQILEKGSDKIWKIVQTINSIGSRLCFTVGDQFVFQPDNTDIIEVYDYNQGNKQFEKVQEVQIQRHGTDYLGQPCQYIQQLNIVVVKSDNYFNIFKIDQNGKYQLLQAIKLGFFDDFGDLGDCEKDFIYGRLSDDGEYLVLWDYYSRQIQMRSLK